MKIIIGISKFDSLQADEKLVWHAPLKKYRLSCERDWFMKPSQNWATGGRPMFQKTCLLLQNKKCLLVRQKICVVFQQKSCLLLEQKTCPGCLRYKTLPLFRAYIFEELTRFVYISWRSLKVCYFLFGIWICSLGFVGYQLSYLA